MITLKISFHFDEKNSNFSILTILRGSKCKQHFITLDLRKNEFLDEINFQIQYFVLEINLKLNSTEIELGFRLKLRNIQDFTYFE